MYVCLCAAVTESEIRDCVARPDVDTVDEVGERCFAGTGCGSCHGRIEALLRADRTTTVVLAESP